MYFRLGICLTVCSGLDSTTALQLVESLHSLAAGGRAIITTIHQPSARLYGLLDKLMLLADGRPLYYGMVRYHTSFTGC
jgi:ABC-type multidrug transport system ATPase subunit